MKIKYGIIALCLAFVANVAAQPGANVVLDKTRVETGDTFTIRVLVAGVNAEPRKVEFSPWQPFLPPENILSESAWSRSGSRWLRQYTLVAFDSATLELPPLTVHLRSGEQVLTNPLQITVWPTPATADVNDAEPIRDILREPTLWTDYWPWAVGALVFLIFAKWFFKKKPVPVAAIQAPPPPGIPAHERALQQLAVLGQQKLWKQGRLEQFYTELSMVVREYLENRFKIPALESTTREILPMLKKTDFPQNLSGSLHEILQEADMAKYAQNPPPDHFHEKALDHARHLVTATSNSNPQTNNQQSTTNNR